MAGWRVAMVASNPQFIEWFIKVKSNIDSGQFRPVMLAATKALSLPDDWYVQLNEVYRERERIACQIMDELGCSVMPGQQGLFLWGRIPENETSVESFTDRVLNKARVFITPGSIFGSNGNRFVRISLCAPADRMNQALIRIKEAELNQ
ncbi:MAG: aminotransferase class I/II-fold pyridoxal phosphate-dependent enzyme, partial [Muribaculaceae bacterium]|nr:aminotransferase class I/II-fold pyridoxal phosphate-dependent enzyme [Muribaculaceae bacterium]